MADARAAFAEARRWCEALGTNGDVELVLAEGKLLAQAGALDEAAARFESAAKACGDERCRARAEVGAGAVLLAQGDQPGARRRLVPAVATLVDAGWWAEAARGLALLARAHLGLGELAPAAMRADEGVRAAARVESRAIQAELAQVRGEVALAAGDAKAARGWLEDARASWTHAHSAPGVLANRLLLARLALDEGAVGEARIHLEAARTWAATLDDAEASITSASLLSDVAAREGHADEARGLAEEALAHAPAPRLAASLLMRLGRLEDAAQAAERVPLGRFPDAERDKVMRERQAIYDARVEQVIAAAGPTANDVALATSERSIARAFMDMLERARAGRESPETAQTFRELGDVDREARLAAARGDLVALARLSRRQAALEAAALGLAPESTDQSLERIERALATLRARIRPDVAVLKYHLGEPRSHLFVITDQGTTRYDLPARSALAPLLVRFADEVATPGARRGDGPTLFATLVAPALDAIGARRRLVIVPHREARLVPFDALPLDARAAQALRARGFVVDAFTTSVAPSIAALVELEDSAPSARRARAIRSRPSPTRSTPGGRRRCRGSS
ncbi:MAG: CHAT domain-containing protein [Myxococcota bacterium]